MGNYAHIYRKEIVFIAILLLLVNCKVTKQEKIDIISHECQSIILKNPLFQINLEVENVNTEILDKKIHIESHRYPGTLIIGEKKYNFNYVMTKIDGDCTFEEISFDDIPKDEYAIFYNHIQEKCFTKYLPAKLKYAKLTKYENHDLRYTAMPLINGIRVNIRIEKLK